MPFSATIVAALVAVNGDYIRQCGRGFMADSIRDSIRIRILTPDSIRYSIRTQTADSQVPILEFAAQKVQKNSFVSYQNVGLLWLNKYICLVL